ncbi:MAG: hypothetical protein HXX13_09745 [Bacteroidetes bacterium]|nr:hypothetical protein [Bacteroidota bacterium]
MISKTFSSPIIAILVVFILLLFKAAPVLGQAKPYNEEITVIAAFDPIIPDAFKINQNPLITDTSTTIPVMTYFVQPRNAGIKLDIDPLPSVKLVAEPLSKIYRNYLKAGFGNYTSIYGELFASSLRSKTSLVGVHFSHISYSGKIKDYAPAANSSQLAEVFGQRYFENHTLSGKVFFKRDGLHLYGFKPDFYPSWNVNARDIKQHYLVSGFETTFGSRYKSMEKLNHNFGLSYYHLSDNYQVKENNLKISAMLDKQADLFKWDTKQTLGLNASLDFYNQKDSVSKINASVLCINPTIAARLNEYSFKAGLIFDIGIDSVTKPHLYPMLEAKIDLLPGALQLYAGIDGGMERNSIRKLMQENPYITSGLPLKYTYDKFRAYGGFSSNISRTFNFNGSISSSTFENYPFFVTDIAANFQNSFTLLYDDISLVKIRAELEFVKADKLRLSLAGNYNHYNLGTQDYAWYKPDYSLDLTANYNFQDKIIFKFQAELNGPVYAPIPTFPDDLNIQDPVVYRKKNINGWVDANLGAEYKFNKALSFWLNINNLGNTRNFSFYNYPSYRINAMGGASYSF